MKIDRRLFRYIQHIYRYFGAILFFSLVTALCIIGQSFYLTSIIDKVFLGKTSLAQVTLPLAFLLSLMIIRSAVIWCTELVSNATASRAKNTLRQRLIVHLQELGPLYVKGERSGEIVNTVTDGVEAMDAYFRQVLPQVCATAIIPALVLLVVFWLDRLSGVILLVTLPILPFFMILIGKQANGETQRRWTMLSQLSAHFLDVLQGSVTLKLFGRSGKQRETIRQISEQYGKTTMKVLRIAFLSAFVMELGATISTALVAVEIGLRLLYGQVPFATAFFVLLLTPEFYQPLRALGPQFHASMESASGAKRIFDILETKPSFSDEPQAVLPVKRATNNGKRSEVNPLAVSLPTTIKGLEIHDVSFTYQMADAADEVPAPRALCGVSFTALRGQMTAIVGPNGSGKSTLAQLLLRFMEPELGEIRVDGRSIRDFSPQQWRQLIAWQPQRPYLFNTTVAENIRMGCSEASDEDVIMAAKRAHIHDVIAALPDGYQTVVGERGSRLSGGEAQRLSLARALVKDAPILLLDEATSTLDPETEALILQTIREVSKERVVLMIAHRLHTIRGADQIVVLKRGEVVTMGTHEELEQQSPFYRDIVMAYAGEGSGL